MILNTSIISLSSQYSQNASPFFILPMILINSHFTFNLLTYSHSQSSFLYGSLFSKLHVSNSQFTHIISPAIILASSRLENTKIEETQLIDSDAQIINCTFVYCTTNKKKWDGGAIYISKPISIQIKKCIFKNNEANKSGGAIYAKSAKSIDIDESLFSSNSCMLSGTIVLKYVGKTSIKSTNITSNFAKSSAVALSIFDSENVKFNQVKIFQNEIKVGSTLVIEKTDADFEDCLFYRNDVITGCGSIRLVKNATAEIANSVFVDEKVPSLVISSNSKANVINCKFSLSRKMAIKERGGEATVDSSTTFNVDYEFKSDQAKQESKDKDNKESESKDKDNKESEDKDSTKSGNKKSKEDTKEDDEPVVVKNGNNNQSQVIFPIQQKQSDDSNFSKSFYLILCIVLLFVIIIIYVLIKIRQNNKISEILNTNNSIFNKEDLDMNQDHEFTFSKNDNHSLLDAKDLPDVKLEKF